MTKKKFVLIRSQWIIIAISSLALLFTVFTVVQVGFKKSEQMLIEKTARLIATNLSKNEVAISDMLDTARKLSGASGTNKTISALLLEAANNDQHKTVPTYSSKDIDRIRQIENLLTYYRNTFFDYQVHSVILGSDGCMYSVLDGVDNSSLFGSNFALSIETQDWYQNFLHQQEYSMWVAPCSYSKTGTFYPKDQLPQDPDIYLIYIRKIRDFVSQKELGISVVSLSTHNLEKLLVPDKGASMALINEHNQVIYTSHGEAKPLFLELFSQNIYPQPEGYVKTNLSDTDYLVNYCSVGATGWELVNLMPYQDAIAEISDLQRFINFFALFITLGAAAICIAMLLYSTAPFSRLFQRMGEMQIGNRQVGENVESTGISNVGGAEKKLNQMLDRIEELSQEALEQQKLEQNLQFEALRAQLNPHFLFNTLNTIKWSAMVSGAGNISEMIASLGRILESSMRRGEEYVSLKTELELVQAYMQIKNWTLKYRLTLHMEIPPELYCCKVFKYCLQPIVENAVIHGLEGMENGVVLIHGWREENTLFLQVRDNGCGMKQEQLSQVLEQTKAVPSEKHHQISGIGISSVNGIMKLRYGAEYGITIKSKPKEGTTVEICLPYEEITTDNQAEEEATCSKQ